MLVGADAFLCRSDIAAVLVVLVGAVAPLLWSGITAVLIMFMSAVASLRCFPIAAGLIMLMGTVCTFLGRGVGAVGLMNNISLIIGFRTAQITGDLLHRLLITAILIMLVTAIAPLLWGNIAAGIVMDMIAGLFLLRSRISAILVMPVTADAFLRWGDIAAVLIMFMVAKPFLRGDITALLCVLRMMYAQIIPELLSLPGKDLIR